MQIYIYIYIYRLYITLHYNRIQYNTIHYIHYIHTYMYIYIYDWSVDYVAQIIVLFGSHPCIFVHSNQACLSIPSPEWYPPQNWFLMLEPICARVKNLEHINIWWFPWMDINGGTLKIIQFIDGIFHCNPSSYWGTSIYGNLHIWKPHFSRWNPRNWILLKRWGSRLR